MPAVCLYVIRPACMSHELESPVSLLTQKVRIRIFPASTNACSLSICHQARLHVPRVGESGFFVNPESADSDFSGINQCLQFVYMSSGPLACPTSWRVRFLC